MNFYPRHRPAEIGCGVRFRAVRAWVEVRGISRGLSDRRARRRAWRTSTHAGRRETDAGRRRRCCGVQEGDAADDARVKINGFVGRSARTAVYGMGVTHERAVPTEPTHRRDLVRTHVIAAPEQSARRPRGCGGRTCGSVAARGRAAGETRQRRAVAGRPEVFDTSISTGRCASGRGGIKPGRRGACARHRSAPGTRVFVKAARSRIWTALSKRRFVFTRRRAPSVDKVRRHEMAV